MEIEVEIEIWIEVDIEIRMIVVYMVGFQIFQFGEDFYVKSIGIGGWKNLFVILLEKGIEKICVKDFQQIGILVNVDYVCLFVYVYLKDLVIGF